MKLRRLSISGFKSFADSLELSFDSGITAIVGPNGCGKSNVADSLRWVLGNQSAKQLRADRMEDVIFSGSSGRRSLGMAEVTVTFDNFDRTLPLEFEEIAFTRRVFRSGDSDFLLNGQRCRLMDITDLIADSGLGSNGYWILEQNMVATIMSARPEDRRFLFDEAAGITKYKIQRHRAELKLESAGADLARIEDIISEVRRNADGLKKQAQLLRRWEKAAEILAQIESLQSWRARESMIARREELSSQLAALRRAEEDAAAVASAFSARAASVRTELERAQTLLDEAHSRSGALEHELAEVLREKAVAEEKLRSSGELAEELRRRAQDLDGKAVLAGQRAEGIEGEIERLREACRTAEARHEETRALAAVAAAAQSSAREALEACRAVVRTARSELEQARKDFEEIRAASARAAAEIGDLAGRKAQLEGEVTELQDACDAASKSASEAEAALAAAVHEAGPLQAALEEAERGLAEVSAARDLAQARHTALAERLSELEKARPSSPEGSIAFSTRAKKGYSAAVAAFLEGFQFASHAEPSSLEGSSGATFAISRGFREAPLPDGALVLSDLVADAPDWAREVLSHAVLAPDRKTALDWFLEGIPVAVVTREGDLFRPEGLVRLGLPGTGTGLVLTALLEQAAARLADSERLLVSAGAAFESAMAGTAGFRERAAEARARVSALEKASAAASALAASRGDSLQTARDRLAGIVARLAAPLEVPGDDELAKALERIGALELREREASAAGESLEREAAGRADEYTAAASVEAAASSGRQIARLQLERAEEDLRSAVSAAESGRTEAAELRVRADATSKAVKEMDRSLKQLDRKADGLRVKCAEAAAARSDATAARAARLEESSAADAALSGAREALTAARESRAQASASLDALLGRIAEMEAGAPAGERPPEGSRLHSLNDEALSAELERSRMERDRLGPVNMLAGREYDEVAARLDFLVAQRDDLVKARQSLVEAIVEINRTAAERFGETFESVRTHFRELFARLFDGGEADITPVEAVDPLEGGVVITARPRGKKVDSLSALSGGERAMTSIALLFALYLVKPAPFCVLDELDAPLDDANVDRFIDMMKSFSTGTQFVVITHNRRTMEAADRLYGITMAEEGVSTLASVSLEQAVE